MIDVDGEVPELRALASYYAGKGGALWAAEASGRIVGMIARCAALPMAHGKSCRLYVLDPSSRGTDLAPRLLATAEAHARAAGATRLVLWSDTRFDRAHRFYEKRSYVRHGPIRVLHDISNSLEFGYAKPVCRHRGAGRRGRCIGRAAAGRNPARLRRCRCVGVVICRRWPLDVAARFWRRMATDVAAGTRILLAAWDDGELAGTVMLEFASSPNQPHRAEVQKLLVHPDARRRGLARALMTRPETRRLASAGRC